MSTNNARIFPVLESEGEAIIVFFTLRNGATRSYLYSGYAAITILAGADPDDFLRERI
jgi:hypothetical protein